ncbi:hypothetical protein CPB83DRAFT_850827 [Crepidotus variabilis]|uniref:Uncharacterized protein n=1 Tax=Crepidotus variabilis TaxID=179855 RepID=A0A9P6EK31_9AGAR|nr:hypothetical protein CPB83DRAFT_850827 [Crepidotus variabilis]
MIRARSSQLTHNSGSAILTGIATVLLLFICISTPVVNSMRMYRISNVINGAIRYVDVGLWGYCVKPLQFGFNSFTFDATVVEGCSRASIGFSLDENVANALKIPEIKGLYSKSFTAILIVFPIATIMTAFSCVLQLTIHLLSKTRGMQLGISSRGVRGIFFFNVLTMFIVFFAFIIQIAVLVTGRARVAYLSLHTSNYRLQFHGENTPWLSGFALLCHFIDLFIINTWRKERLHLEQQKDTEKGAKKAKNMAKNPKQNKGKKAQSALLDAEPVSKSEGDIVEEKKEDAISLPEYKLDGYVIEAADSTKKA